MLGASAKTRSLKKLSHPALLLKQTSQTSDVYLRNCEILDVFWSIQVACVDEEPLCNLEMPSGGLKLLHSQDYFIKTQ